MTTANPTHIRVAALTAWDRQPVPPGPRLADAHFDHADHIQVLLRDADIPSGTPFARPDIGVYGPVRRLEETECAHAETICRTCRRQWEEDHFLDVFEHGANGAPSNGNCRCPACAATSSTRQTPTDDASPVSELADATPPC